MGTFSDTGSPNSGRSPNSHETGGEDHDLLKRATEDAKRQKKRSVARRDQSPFSEKSKATSSNDLSEFDALKAKISEVKSNTNRAPNTHSDSKKRILSIIWSSLGRLYPIGRQKTKGRVSFSQNS